MLIVLVLLAAWFALNVAFLGAVAVANHRGRQAAGRSAVVPAQAPVFATAR